MPDIYIFVWVTYTLAKLPTMAGISWTKQGDAQTSAHKLTNEIW